MLTINNNVLNFLKNKGNSASFVAFNGYVDRHGEKSNQEIITNIDYGRILRESLEKLNQINKVETDEGVFYTDDDIFNTAKSEIIESLVKSIAGENERGNALAQFFTPISKNVKIHNETGIVHISGVAFKKTVIEVGNKKPTKSRTKTKIKNAIRDQLPISKYRDFSLNPEKQNLDNIAIAGEVFTLNRIYS